MGRQSLRVTMLLGVLITALGGTGIFAAFTDRATTGVNSVESGSRPRAVDIMLAQATLNPSTSQVECGQFSHDLATGIFSVQGVQPGAFPNDAEVSYVCLKNVGSGTISIDAKVIDVVDVDTACTGDEAEAGDATCGGSQQGELSAALALQIEDVACATGSPNGLQSNSVANWPANPVPLPAPLAAGAVTCARFLTWIPASTDESILQVVQSDLVEWRIAFDAALAP